MLKDKLGLIVILCLTLGLAPFVPEPHLWGKLKWVMGGAKGMELLDWFDFFWHGFPFILLLLALIGEFFPRASSPKT